MLYYQARESWKEKGEKERRKKETEQKTQTGKDDKRLEKGLYQHIVVGVSMYLTKIGEKCLCVCLHANSSAVYRPTGAKLLLMRWCTEKEERNIER